MQIQSAPHQAAIAVQQTPIQRPGGGEQQESAAQEARESPAQQRMEGELTRPTGAVALDLIA